MSEDLRQLSWFEIALRVEELTAQCEANEDTIQRQSRQIMQLRGDVKDIAAKKDALQAELKAAQDSLAKLESPPVFEVGKCYRNKRGEITEPLRAAADGPYVFRDPKTLQTYDARGMRFANDLSDFDLVAGPVSPPPTWTPPRSLPDGEYTLGKSHVEGAMKCDRTDLSRQLNWSDTHPPRTYKDWTDPPKVGRWRVENGAATWLGDA